MKKLLVIGFIAVALATACGNSSSSSSSTTTTLGTTTTSGPRNAQFVEVSCLDVGRAGELDDGLMANAIGYLMKSNVPELVDAANKITQAPTLAAQIAILQGTVGDWCRHNGVPTK